MPNKESLLKDVASHLHTYLKAGQLNVDSFSKKIHQQIDQFEKLFLIRFLAKEETRAFVSELPQLIRQFKTTTILKKEVNQSEIRGAIDWDETFRLRSERNYKDKTLFVTSENYRSYDTQENLVLKEALMVLYHLLFEEAYVGHFFKQDYFKTWESLRYNVADALRQNVYLKRVSSLTVSDRMIHNTRKHRNPLYRKAANLLGHYRHFIRGNFDQEELELLLRETFIIPNEIEVLFELYWVIHLMQLHTDKSTMHLMDGRTNLVASWEDDDFTYEIYHDSDGPEDLKWAVHTDELLEGENLYTKKLYQIHEKTKVYAQSLFDRGKNNWHWQGRPDILLVKRSKFEREIVSVTIGEVKYSNQVSTATNGLEELITYMNLMKHEGHYKANIEVNGILCIKNMDLATSELENIRVLMPDKIKEMEKLG